MPAEEPVQHYVCAIRAVCKAEEDSDDEEQSAQPVRRLICGAAIAQPVKAPNKSPAVAESKAEADVGNGYSVFPVRSCANCINKIGVCRVPYYGSRTRTFTATTTSVSSVVAAMKPSRKWWSRTLTSPPTNNSVSENV